MKILITYKMNYFSFSVFVSSPQKKAFSIFALARMEFVCMRFHTCTNIKCVWWLLHTQSAIIIVNAKSSTNRSMYNCTCMNMCGRFGPYNLLFCYEMITHLITRITRAYICRMLLFIVDTHNSFVLASPECVASSSVQNMNHTRTVATVSACPAYSKWICSD